MIPKAADSSISQRFIITYQDFCDNDRGKFSIWNAAGAQIVAATAITDAVATNIAATALTATTFVIAYTDDSDGSKGKFWIGSTETGAKFSAAAVAFDSQRVSDISVAKLTDTRFVVVYRALDHEFRGKFWIWDTSIGAGGQQMVPPTTFNLNPTSSIHAIAVTNSQFAVVFVDAAASVALWVGGSFGQQTVRQP